MFISKIINLLISMVFQYWLTIIYVMFTVLLLVLQCLLKYPFKMCNFVKKNTLGYIKTSSFKIKLIFQILVSTLNIEYFSKINTEMLYL